MSSNPSICIPRIESNITKKIITNAFEKFGNVDRIDIVNSGRRSRKAFIHFKRWIPRTQCHQSFLTMCDYLFNHPLDTKKLNVFYLQ